MKAYRQRVATIYIGKVEPCGSDKALLSVSVDAGTLQVGATLIQDAGAVLGSVEAIVTYGQQVAELPQGWTGELQLSSHCDTLQPGMVAYAIEAT